MATALPPPVVGTVSQQPQCVSTQVSREYLDVALIPTQPLAQVLDPPRPTITRARFSYSKKNLIANSSLFLHPINRDRFPNPAVELIGKVKECARASNGNRYLIDWRNNGGRPLPVGLDPSWLQEYYSKDFGPQLKEAIIRYEELHPKVINSGNNTIRIDGERIAATPTNGVNGTPPAIIRGRAAAAVTTASHSSISTISTLTNSQPRTRRSTTPNIFENGIDSDIEDGSDFEDVEDDDGNIEIIPARTDVDDGEFSDDDEVFDRNDKDNDSDDEDEIQCNVAELASQLKWKFEKVEEGVSLKDKSQPELYDGPSGLKNGVAQKFENPLECLSYCGGLDYVFISRLTSNSNEYARKHILPKNRNRRFHGEVWRHITTEEMHHFLGITLKISLSPIDSGGYKAYFRKQNQVIHGLEIESTVGFAQRYMTMYRYKQIRSSFHPESKYIGTLSGDKAYQLRHAINSLNAASARTFHCGADLTFDEGGIGSRSRRNPIRQYNSQKPDKFRIDFFILSCATLYCVHHIDVYQGKNSANIGIDDSVRTCKTTMKYVLNAVIACKLAENVFGARHLALDNRYQCPELAYLLRERYNVLSTGTNKANRVGWDKELMNLTKKEAKGTTLFSYDRTNRILATQWVDSKVVNCVSTLVDTTMESCQRQKGSDSVVLPCPKVVRKYQQTMGAVDRGDQIRAHGGGFAKKAHYQKWYKKGFFAMLDIMLLNSLIAWNESTKARGVLNRVSLKRHQFYTYIAKRLLKFEDCEEGTVGTVQTETPIFEPAVDGEGTHTPLFTKNRVRCMVCKLELGMNKSLGEKGLTTQVCVCSCCGLSAHHNLRPTNRHIHQLDEFQDMTCFQILHSEQGRKMWHFSLDGKHRYKPNYSNPIYQKLRDMHGLNRKVSRKRKEHDP